MGLWLTPLSLSFLQILDSLHVAGAASQLLYARIDAQRFVKIYSAKGRWGLLDQLLLSAAPAATSAPVASALRAPNRPAPAVVSQQAPAMRLADVVEAVKKAASEILGEDMEGRCSG